MVLRYVDKAGNIREAFVGLVECDQGTLGQAVCDANQENPAKFWPRSEYNCRGQGYAGAGNMAERYISVAEQFNSFETSTHRHLIFTVRHIG